MLVFPAVDIAKGRCVRLLQGKPERETVYYQSPVAAALHWQEQGAECLHVVDLDGALAGGGVNAEPVQEILDGVAMPVQVAGGLRTEEALRLALDAGASRVVVGTQAARDPAWAVEVCRRLPDRVVVAVDALEGRVAVEGWQELLAMGPAELAQRLAEGPPAAFLYTDVSRDGMFTRPNFEGVEDLMKAVEVPVIASGGVAELEDIRRLGECGADAVIIGKALYDGRFTLSEALDAASGYATRLSSAPDGE